MVKKGRPFKKQKADHPQGTKRAIVDYDDDFDDDMPIALAHKLRQEMCEEMEEMDVGHAPEPSGSKKDSTLYFKRSALDFVKMTKKLNPRQIEAVHEMGFGATLHYNITDLPGALAHWILAVFNKPRCRIEFSADESLHMRVLCRILSLRECFNCKNDCLRDTLTYKCTITNTVMYWDILMRQNIVMYIHIKVM